MAKKILRERLLQKLRQQPESARLAKSRKIAGKLRRLALYRKARFLLCYAAFDGEVETRPVLAQALADGKRVAVPVTRSSRKGIIPVEIRGLEELNHRGAFGIPEPAVGRRVPMAAIDLVVVPGLAFDRELRRLGRGGGYFDRFLAKVPRRVPRVGLAFRFQLLKELPWEPHDQPVSKVIADS
ncbi:MAG: 5-formyltetrahydrofolate cyclo-ligase [Candidatus Omnitrophica bacterium]|nr:5-formyltetrahydrofolate cyclo-ligase [Candidatus Omnitrophota bacterium]